MILLLIINIASLLLMLLLGYKIGYQKGYYNGYKKGYSDVGDRHLEMLQQNFVKKFEEKIKFNGIKIYEQSN
jgi:hypothetical protein